MDHLEFVKELGKGTFGVVNLYVKKHNRQKVVIKEIDLEVNCDHVDAARNEVEILKALDNPNVIRYYDSYIRNGKFCIMMEYATKNTLHDFVLSNRPQLLQPQVVMNLFVQLLMGLNHIHAKKVIHRDLKPQNVFLTGLKGDVVKIGDFGTSKILKKAKTSTFIGTYNYFSPEICHGCPYDYKSDMWALGCILHELCALERAFEGNPCQVMEKIKIGTRRGIDAYRYGQQLQSLIDDLLGHDPNQRPDTLMLMAHPDVFPTLHTVGVDLGCIV